MVSQATKRHEEGSITFQLHYAEPLLELEKILAECAVVVAGSDESAAA
jgi:hypothetical protein